MSHSNRSIAALKADLIIGIHARRYLQTPLPLPEFFPIGQWNRFKQREVRHLTEPLALKLVQKGTKVSLTGSLMRFVMGLLCYFL